MDETPETRVGDRERAEVDAWLQHAHGEGRITLAEYEERAGRCHAARTRRELDPLTADLGPAPSAGPTRATTPAPEPVPREAEPRRADAPRPDARRPRRRRRGRVPVVGALVLAAAAGSAWVLQAADGSTILGSETVAVAPTQSSVSVGELLGTVRVVVPDGTHVQTDGTEIAGSTTCRQACVPGAPGEPTVVVFHRGAFGDLEVVTRTEDAATPRDDDH